jgi:hypothetical protein
VPQGSAPIRRRSRAEAEAVLGRPMSDDDYETFAPEPEPESVASIRAAATQKRQNLAAAQDRGWNTSYWRRSLCETRFKLARETVRALPLALRRPGCDRRPAGGRPRFRRASRSSRGSPSDGSGSAEPPLAGADRHKRGVA